MTLWRRFVLVNGRGFPGCPRPSSWASKGWTWTWSNSTPAVTTTGQARHGQAPVYSTVSARPHSDAPGVSFADPDPASAGAHHTSELPFGLVTLDAFNLFRTTRATTPDDHRISAALVQALIAFARTGTPAAADVNVPRFDAFAQGEAPPPPSGPLRD